MLLMHCGLGLECHGVVVVIIHMFTLSFFHPKPSYEMHNGNVILNSIFAYL